MTDISIVVTDLPPYQPPIDKFIKACGSGDIDVVREFLQDKNIDPAYNDNAAIQCATKKGHTEIVRLLIADPRVDPSVRGLVFNDACRRGHFEIVKMLLEDGRIDPTEPWNHPLRAACLNGQIEIVRLLMADNRVDPSNNSNLARWEACRTGQTDIVRLLLSDRRVIENDSDIERDIQIARISGYTEIVQLLVANRRTDVSGNRLNATPLVDISGQKHIIYSYSHIHDHDEILDMVVRSGFGLQCEFVNLVGLMKPSVIPAGTSTILAGSDAQKWLEEQISGCLGRGGARAMAAPAFVDLSKNRVLVNTFVSPFVDLSNNNMKSDAYTVNASVDYDKDIAPYCYSSDELARSMNSYGVSVQHKVEDNRDYFLFTPSYKYNNDTALGAPPTDGSLLAIVFKTRDRRLVSLNNVVVPLNLFLGTYKFSSQNPQTDDVVLPPARIELRAPIAVLTQSVVCTTMSSLVETITIPRTSVSIVIQALQTLTEFANTTSGVA